MKRTSETVAPQEIADSTALFPGMRISASAVENAPAQRASNDASGEAPVRAIDAMALCMASSTFGG
jgi:hypothetical protein